MTDLSLSLTEFAKAFPAIIVRVISDRKVVINKGSLQNIKINQRFIIYSIDEEEIKDPKSGELLGKLEIVKGTGKVIHVQEKISTLISDQYEETSKRVKKKIENPIPIMSILGLKDYEVIEEIPERNLVPFDNPKIGDFAKPI